MQHPYFGKLNLNDDCLYANYDNDFSILIFDLYFDENHPRVLDIDVLDKCAEHCKNIEHLDKQARQKLLNYLTTDTGFVERKSQELNRKMTAKYIVDGLIFTHCVMFVGKSNDEHYLVLDYLFDEEECFPDFEVRFHLDGRFNFILWQSEFYSKFILK